LKDHVSAFAWYDAIGSLELASSKAVRQLILLACLTLGCGPRILVGDDDGTMDGSTGTIEETSVAVTTQDPTTAGSGSAGPTTANPTTVDPSDTSDDQGDDGDPACSPFDECMTSDDCLPGQTCLANCVCFGQPNPACDEAESCDACVDCQLDIDGACETQMQACQANPQCAALMACLIECEGEPMCVDACYSANPAGQSDFFEVVQCVVAACPSSCP
jgi:hypothetical protein